MNIFSVLGESDDDEQPKTVPQKKGKDAAAKTETAPKKDAPKGSDAPKPAKTAGAEVPKSSKGKENSTAPNTTKASGNGKAPEKAADAEGDVAKENNRGGRDRGKDPKKIARGAEDGAKPKKHEHDRRPAGGRGRGEQSRGGRGAFGFGNPAQEAHDAERDPASAEVAVESPDNGETAAVEEEPESNEPATRSFDEYMARREEARAKVLVDVKPIREVKKTEFVGLVAAKEEDSPDIWKSTKAAAGAAATSKEQRSDAKTSVLDVGFKFEAVRTDRDDREGRGGRGRGDRGDRGDRPPREGSSRGGGGRGGRGGSRGSGRAGGEGSSSGRGGSARGAVFSDQDFPSL